jgi:hypothetical protein
MSSATTSHVHRAPSRRQESAGTAPPPSAAAGRPGSPPSCCYRPCPSAVSATPCSPSPPLSLFPHQAEFVAVPGRRRPRRLELPVARSALRAPDPKEEEDPRRFAVRPPPFLVNYRSFLESCKSCRKPPRSIRFLRNQIHPRLFYRSNPELYQFHEHCLLCLGNLFCYPLRSMVNLV